MFPTNSLVAIGSCFCWALGLGEQSRVQPECREGTETVHTTYFALRLRVTACIYSKPATEYKQIVANWKNKTYGGVLGFIGFMLSPLSWWNDLFVNVPLALAFAWIVSLFYKPAFEIAWIIGYWLTNVLGLVLMHKGAQKIFSGDEPAGKYSRKDLAKDVVVSLLYTLLIVVLIKFKMIQPITNYLPTK
jgi:hypothetical protein